MNKYEIEIQQFQIQGDTIFVEWSANIGWGEFTLTQEEDGSLSFDTECLGSDFLSELLDVLKNYILDKFK